MAFHIQQFLADLEGIELAVLQSKVPVVSTGKIGTAIAILLIAEEQLGQFLSNFGKPSTPPVPVTPQAASDSGFIVSAPIVATPTPAGP